MRTPQQIIIQSPILINTPQRPGSNMKLDHFIQYLRIQFLILNVWIPSTTGLFHGEGDIVAEADVTPIVEAAAGTVGAVTVCDGWDGWEER